MSIKIEYFLQIERTWNDRIRKNDEACRANTKAKTIMDNIAFSYIISDYGIDSNKVISVVITETTIGNITLLQNANKMNEI